MLAYLSRITVALERLVVTAENFLEDVESDVIEELTAQEGAPDPMNGFSLP